MLQSAKNYIHLLKAIRAVKKYNNPANGLIVIGVTGTDGKTTTASLIYHILKESGVKVALISTVAAYIGDKKYDTGFHVSTPQSAMLQAYIAKVKKAGMTHLVLEVTSHALDQHRVHGINFEVGVLTNVTHEHLDYHKTMEKYMAAKAKLLLASRVAVLNRDDDSYNYMKKRLEGKTIISYGLKDNTDVNPKNHSFKTKLVGTFNTYNSLAALAVSDILEIDPHKVQKAIESFKPPEGRVDVIYDESFKVIIDFAHTPNGIKNILEAMKETVKSGNIIHVFGSAGRRDSSKRPMMGKISSELADTIILTSEDPRNESPEKIAEEIRSGMPIDKQNVRIITDRQDAITQAVALAKKGDIVIITGKGHEQSMNIGHGEEHWSDHEAVVKALEHKMGKVV